MSGTPAGRSDHGWASSDRPSCRGQSESAKAGQTSAQQPVKVVLQISTTSKVGHRYKKHVFKAFYYFLYKKRVLTVFYFLNVFFYFLVAQIWNSTKPAKLLHKTTFKWWI